VEGRGVLKIIGVATATADNRSIAPFHLLGAVFGVLQAALGVEFLSDGIDLAIRQRVGI
jgi:hypothetical protein